MKLKCYSFLVFLVLSAALSQNLLASDSPNKTSTPFEKCILVIKNLGSLSKKNFNNLYNQNLQNQRKTKKVTAKSLYHLKNFMNKDSEGYIAKLAGALNHGWKVMMASIQNFWLKSGLRLREKTPEKMRRYALFLKNLNDQGLISFEHAEKVFWDFNKNNPDSPLSDYLKLDHVSEKLRTKFIPDKKNALYVLRKMLKGREDALEWMSFFKDLNLNTEEAELIAQKLPLVFPFMENNRIKEVYQSYIKHSFSYLPKKAYLALQEIDKIDLTKIFDNYWYNLVQDREAVRDTNYLEYAKKTYSQRNEYSDDSSFLKSFYKLQRDLDRNKFRRFKRNYHFLKSTRDMDDEEAMNMSHRAASIQRHNLENLVLGCHMKRKNKAHKNALDDFSTFMVAVAMSSTTFGYFTKNECKNFLEVELWMKYFYELGVVTLANVFLAKIFSMPASSKTKKYFYGLGTNSIIDVASSGAYDAMFGVSKEDLIEKYYFFLKDRKNFRSNLKELLDHVEQIGAEEEFLDAFIKEKGIVNVRPKALSSQEWKALILSSITESDVSNPEIKKYLLAATHHSMVKANILNNPEDVQYKMTVEAVKKLYPHNKDIMLKMLEALNSNPNYKKAVDNTLAKIDWDNIEDSISKAMSELTMAHEMQRRDHLTPNSWDYDIENLTKEDLRSTEDIKEVMLNALNHKLYKDQSAKDSYDLMGLEVPTLQTGSIFWDRLIYGRGWNVFTGLKKLAVGLIIYKLLCAAGPNKPQMIALAISITIIDKFIFETLYFELRNGLIGQNAKCEPEVP